MSASQDHRLAYAQRMQRVQVYIDDNLYQPLRLNELAAVANFSPFHFHRLFQAWVGETPSDYLRRRRLEAAAMRLAAQPRAQVLDIALSVGFGSAEAFSRAFKGRYGLAPTRWRASARQQLAEKPPSGHQSKMDHADVPGLSKNEGSFVQESYMTQPVRVVALPLIELIGLSHQGPYGEPVVNFWRDTALPWFAMAGLSNRPLYGISRDDSGVTDSTLQRYEACAPLFANEKHLQIEPPVFRVALPGGRYAVLSFNGAVQQIQMAWTSFLRDWLPRTGFQLDARPCFERYAADASEEAATGTLRADLFIPISNISVAP